MPADGGEAVRRGFVWFYLSPAGRVSRSQFWLKFVLPVGGIEAVLNLLASLDADVLPYLLNIFQLIVLWPGIAVLVKRVHDRDRSGWLAWALYGPLILTAIVITMTVTAADADGDAPDPLAIAAGILALIDLGVGLWFMVEFGCRRGTLGPNRYGPDPLARA